METEHNFLCSQIRFTHEIRNTIQLTVRLHFGTHSGFSFNSHIYGEKWNIIALEERRLWIYR